MMKEKGWAELIKQMGESPREAIKSEQGHLDAAMLFDYLDDLLNPTEELEVQSHLSACSACGDLLLELREPEPFDVDDPVPGDVKADWETRISGKGERDVPVIEMDRLPRPNQAVVMPWLVALAAVVIAAFSWLTVPSAGQAVLSQPVANIPIVALVPEQDQVRNGSKTTVTNQQALVLALSYSGNAISSSFALSLESDSGERIWQGPASRDANGMFTAAVPANFLPIGPYKVILSGDGEVLEHYLFHVQDHP